MGVTEGTEYAVTIVTIQFWADLWSTQTPQRDLKAHHLPHSRMLPTPQQVWKTYPRPWKFSHIWAISPHTYFAHGQTMISTNTPSILKTVPDLILTFILKAYGILFMKQDANLMSKEKISHPNTELCPGTAGFHDWPPWLFNIHFVSTGGCAAE